MSAKSSSDNSRPAAALALLVALNAAGPGALVAFAQVVVPGAPTRIGFPGVAPLSAPLPTFSAGTPLLAPSGPLTSTLGATIFAAAPAPLPAAAALVQATPLPISAEPMRANGTSAEIGLMSARIDEKLKAVGPLSETTDQNANVLGDNIQSLIGGGASRTDADAAVEPESAAGGAAGEQTPEQKVMLRTLKQIVALFTEHYAPIDWKKSQLGVDYNAEYERIRARVLAEPRLPQHEFQKLLAGFLSSTRDYHAGISFYSTESAELPLTILNAGGRYYIAAIDRKALPQSRFPYQPGDEIVEFGGQPTAQAAAALLRTPNTTETDARRAALGLTRRSRRSGSDVPQGDVALKIKTADGTTHKATLTWNYEPELIPTDVPVREGGIGPEAASGITAPIAADLSPERAAVRENLQRLLPSMAASDAARQTAAARAQPEANQAFMLGGKKSFVPTLGEVVWQLPQQVADQIPFTAYIYKDAQGRRIGYLRIPSYIGDENAANVFGQIVAAFEKQTDALVLDQVNNPGGSVFYMYSLLSMLSGKPLAVPGHRMLLDESDAAAAAQIIQQSQDPTARKLLAQELLSATDGPGVSVKPSVDQLVSYAHAILNELKAGRRLTDPNNPIYMLGVNEIPPAETSYTKPIVVLVNELDFSGGDFLPAILQDNGRATIFGVRTAGAGGAVKSASPANQSGVERVSYTWTIAQRLNGQPIENLGVTPDVGYAITPKDLRDGFSGYAEALNAAVAARLDASKPRRTRKP